MIYNLKLKGTKSVEIQQEAESLEEAKTIVQNKLSTVGLEYVDENLSQEMWDSIIIETC